jgi:hypothetical protein
MRLMNGLKSGLVLTTGLLLASSMTAHGQAVGDEIMRARAAIKANDVRAAVEILESGLTHAEASVRRAIREELKSVYAQAAIAAEASGDKDHARAYRENLSILQPAKPANPQQTSSPTPAQAAPIDRPSIAPPRPVVDSAVEKVAVKAVAAEATPSPAQPSPPEGTAAADAAFRAKNYAEAGRLYAALDAAGSLPQSRFDHWAYCRCVDVVRRINDGPKSAAEWTTIHAEVAEIRRLAPKNWFGEYLRNLAEQRSAATKGGVKPTALIVRGADPDDFDEPESPPRRDPIDGPAPPRLGNWKIQTTANFRILFDDPSLADRVAALAETLRDEQYQKWTGSPPPRKWSPVCDIYLYPNRTTYQKRTGQPDECHGFSTIGHEGGKVVSRRLNLHADQDQLIESVLPHELTHIVLADLFLDARPPLWAGEGLAALSESDVDQASRLALLGSAIGSGELFHLSELMADQHPAGNHWELYCAQSSSVARFLIDRATPARFIDFLRGCKSSSLESELSRLYGITSLDELERLWLADARAKIPQSASTTPSR